MTMFVFGLPILAGCGGPSRYASSGTGLGAGADGEMQVSEMDDGTKMVQLALTHLPPANRVGDKFNVYQVWFVAKKQPAQKAGTLAYSDESREGRLTATSPYQAFTVVVTAEADGTVDAPGEHVVFRQEVD